MKYSFKMNKENLKKLFQSKAILGKFQDSTNCLILKVDSESTCSLYFKGVRHNAIFTFDIFDLVVEGTITEETYNDLFVFVNPKNFFTNIGNSNTEEVTFSVGEDDDIGESSGTIVFKTAKTTIKSNCYESLSGYEEFGKFFDNILSTDHFSTTSYKVHLTKEILSLYCSLKGSLTDSHNSICLEPTCAKFADSLSIVRYSLVEPPISEGSVYIQDSILEVMSALKYDELDVILSKDKDLAYIDCKEYPFKMTLSLVNNFAFPTDEELESFKPITETAVTLSTTRENLISMASIFNGGFDLVDWKLKPITFYIGSVTDILTTTEVAQLVELPKAKKPKKEVLEDKELFDENMEKEEPKETKSVLVTWDDFAQVIEHILYCKDVKVPPACTGYARTTVSSLVFPKLIELLKENEIVDITLPISNDSENYELSDGVHLKSENLDIILARLL